MSLDQTKCVPDFAMASMLIVGIFKENICCSTSKGILKKKFAAPY